MSTFIDLFAGIGGIRTGFEQAGMHCVYTSEKDPHAQKMYALNYGEIPHGDIVSIDATTIPDHDIILAGFPCQPFSSAGLKQGFDDTRGTLFFDILRIAKAKKTKVILLENVKNLVNHDSGNTFKVIVSALEDMGYMVSWEILNAKDFGVPQSRERIVIVASRIGSFDFSAIAKLPEVKLLDFLDIEDPLQPFEYIDSNDYILLDDSIVKKQASGLVFAGYRKGNLRGKVKEGSENFSRAHKQQNRIYSSEGVHPTISSQETSGRFFILHNDKVRKLTMRECYRLFGFPEDFKLIGSLAEQYKRIGNSVCVPMMEAIAEQINRQLLDPEVHNEPIFPIRL